MQTLSVMRNISLRPTLRQQGWLSVISLLLTLFAVAHVQAAVITNSLSPRKLVVGCELSYPPFSLTKSDHTADGFTVELWKAVAKEAGLPYEIKVAPFHEVLVGFQEGNIDVMINLAESDARKEFSSFAVPHVTMHGGIFVRKDSRIKSEADFPGKKLIVLNRDLAHDYALARGWTNLITVDDVESGLQLLSKDTGDAMLVGKLVGLNELREHKISNVHALDQQLEFFQKFAFAVKKDTPGNTELLAKINEGLALVKAKGIYDSLYEKWFGILEPRTPSLMHILKVAIPAIVVITLLSMAYVFERRLRLRFKQSLSTLNATLESTADGILVTDPKGGILNYNRNFLTIWNLGDGLMVSGDSEKIFAHIASQTENPDAFKSSVNCLYEQPETERFEVIHLKDGRCLERYSKPQYVDGRSYGRVCCLRDVTAREVAAKQAAMFNQELERRVTERTLQLEAAGLALQRLSYVASQTSNFVIICSPEGAIEWVNQAFERRTGWTLDEVKGKKPGQFLQGPETDLGTVAQMRKAIAAQEQIRVEILNYSKLGEKYWAEVDISPVKDINGKVINFVSIQTDVTERLQASMELVRQREELAGLNSNLQKALQSRDEFLAAMSHELRTPLNNMLTLTEILTEQDFGPLNEQQLKYMNQVFESGDHLLELINDILDLAKIESGGNALDCEWCDVESLCESSLRLIRPSAVKKQQDLQFVSDIGEMKIWADPRRIKQVLVNLLGNAVKFTHIKGQVQLSSHRIHDSVVFEVSDNGIGIDVSKRSRLFKPFVQLDSGLSRQYDGTGLGLALVRGLVEQHGGRILVDSEPGKGSKFTVYIPLQKRPAKDTVDGRTKSAEIKALRTYS
ncbi:MAG TPA: transporter substrate-binding domain-containing protein [Verrucomicrobiae bacterium]